MPIPKKYFEVLPNFSNERTRKFTGIVLTLIAIPLFALFAINPTLSTIARLKKELKDNEFVDKSLQQKINNLSLLQKQYSQIQPDLPVVFLAVPNESNVPHLMGEIQSVASSSNIRLDTLQNFKVELAKQKDPENKKYYSYSFSLSGVGSYEDILKFVTTLIDMQRVVNIDILSLNKTTDEEKILRINLQGTAYYKK